jgi:hypothetical protein
MRCRREGVQIVFERCRATLIGHRRDPSQVTSCYLLGLDRFGQSLRQCIPPQMQGLFGPLGGIEF